MMNQNELFKGMNVLKTKFILCTFFFFFISNAWGLYSPIEDQGQFFSPTIIKKLDNILSGLEQKTRPSKTIIIKTRKEIPDGLQLDQFFRSLYPQPPFDGVFVFLLQKPRKILMASSKGTQRKLDKKHLLQARGLMIDNFKKNKYDEGLMAATKHLYQNLIALYSIRSTPDSKVVTSNAMTVPRKVAVPKFPWTKILWFVVIAGLIGMVISAMQKKRRGSLSTYGSNYPKSQYGQDSNNDRYGPGGFGSGGGGGGMFKSVLGGIGGAMAGNWIYDKFFRSNHTTNSSDIGSMSDAHASTPQYEDNFDTYKRGDSDFGDISGSFDSGDDWGGFDGGSDFDGGDDW